jgi:alanine racemase
LNLQLVLQIKTRITSIKTIKAGERIGYSGAHIVKRDTRVATIPMGYNEGIDRRLSDKGIVLVNGISCNILGRVSMNITSIDVSDVPSIQLDDEVVVISDNRSDENSIENIAKQCGTIPYEITVHFPESLQRHVM